MFSFWHLLLQTVTCLNMTHTQTHTNTLVLLLKHLLVQAYRCSLTECVCTQTHTFLPRPLCIIDEPPANQSYRSSLLPSSSSSLSPSSGISAAVSLTPHSLLSVLSQQLLALLPVTLLYLSSHLFPPASYLPPLPVSLLQLITGVTQNKTSGLIWLAAGQIGGGVGGGDCHCMWVRLQAAREAKVLMGEKGAVNSVLRSWV